MPRRKPNPFHDTDGNSHTTNPAVTSKSEVPVNASGQAITSLRNRYHFPSAAGLPHDDDTDKDKDYFAYDLKWNWFQPKKHWAYLGEITDMKQGTSLVPSRAFWAWTPQVDGGLEVGIW